MKRLTSERCNGIKRGYWSPSKKDELVQRLGRYEDTGLEPEEIKPIVHAHWEQANSSDRVCIEGEYMCSACHGLAAMNYHGVHCIRDKRCRQCGALMENAK